MNSKPIPFPFLLICFLIFSTVLLFSPKIFAAETHVSPPVTQQPLDYNLMKYRLPKGMAVQVILETPISTAVNHRDDPILAMINHELYYQEELLLTKNTRFKGHIQQIAPAIEGRNGILKITFTEMTLDNGERLPVKCHLRTKHHDHAWGGEVTRGTKPVNSLQYVTGIGAYNRTVFAGPRAMGQPVKLYPGKHLTLILDEPISIVRPKRYKSNPDESWTPF
ncbi:MAG: hypothetical protein AAGI66_08570 [Cyanobacteria bacterium P01_H01_bin.74]